MTNMKNPQFTLGEGLIMQLSQVNKWKSVIKPEFHKLLDNEVLKLNDAVRATWKDGYDVPRGTEIDQIIHNFQNTTLPVVSQSFNGRRGEIKKVAAQILPKL